MIDKSIELPRLVGAVKPGTKSALTVFRRGSVKEINVVIGEIESDKVAQKAPERDEKPKATAAVQLLGLTVVDITDAQKKELKVKSGVKVEAATEASARAGLREGDVIVAIANTEIGSVKEFDAAVAKIDKSKAINVLFRRGDWAQYALIRPAR